MKVLITGANGQVGRMLLASAPESMDIVGCSHADLHIEDWGEVRACVAQYHPDLIINAAAYTAVDKAEVEVEHAQRVNAQGPRCLAEAARESGARLIHISTDYVFDGSACRPYRPDDPTKPLGVYGQTKRDGELAVLEVLPDSAAIVRTAWVYASTGKNFVRTMLRVMSDTGSVRVVADQVGSPTAARSLSDTLWRVAMRPEIRGIHHWTDAGIASWYDFAVAIMEEGAAIGLLPPSVAVIPIATADYPTLAPRPAYSVLNTHSLTSLGFAPTHWRERLRRALKEIASA